MAILGLLSLGYILYRLFEEAAEPYIPADYYNNQELYRKDTMNPDISTEEVIRNVRNGKYR